MSFFPALKEKEDKVKYSTLNMVIIRYDFNVQILNYGEFISRLTGIYASSQGENMARF